MHYCTPWLLAKWSRAPSWPGMCRAAGVVWEITSKGTSSALKHTGILCCGTSGFVSPPQTHGAGQALVQTLGMVLGSWQPQGLPPEGGSRGS